MEISFSYLDADKKPVEVKLASLNIARTNQGYKFTGKLDSSEKDHEGDLIFIVTELGCISEPKPKPKTKTEKE